MLQKRLIEPIGEGPPDSDKVYKRLTLLTRIWMSSIPPSPTFNPTDTHPGRPYHNYWYNNFIERFLLRSERRTQRRINLSTI